MASPFSFSYQLNFVTSFQQHQDSSDNCPLIKSRDFSYNFCGLISLFTFSAKCLAWKWSPPWQSSLVPSPLQWVPIANGKQDELSVLSIHKTRILRSLCQAGGLWSRRSMTHIFRGWERSLLLVIVRFDISISFTKLSRSRIPKFAANLTPTATARSELNTYVIKLQHMLITLLSESNSTAHVVLPTVPSLISTSEELRVGVVTILAEQYQRMIQAAPIRRSLISKFFRSSSRVSMELATQTISVITAHTIQTDERLCRYAQLSRIHKLKGKHVYKCHCGAEQGDSKFKFIVLSSQDKEKLRIETFALLQSHMSPDDWFCTICERSVYSFFNARDEVLILHLKEHTSTEIETAFPSRVLRCLCVKDGAPCNSKCEVKNVLFK